MKNILKIICLSVFLSIAIFSMSYAAVFTTIVGAHVSAPIDPAAPVLEMNMRIEDRDADPNKDGYQDQLLKTKGSGWDVIHQGFTAPYGGKDAVKLFYYEIDAKSYAKDDAALGINVGAEKLAVTIKKDYEAMDASEVPGLNDAEAIWDTAYSKELVADSHEAFGYLRVTRFLMKVGYYDGGGNLVEHTVFNQAYGAGVLAAETGMLIGANYFGGETANHLKFKICQVANAPAKLLFGIWLPKFFKFVEFSWKFGIKFMGLVPPDEIRVKFFRVKAADYVAPTQIEVIAPADKVELPLLQLNIVPAVSFFGIIYTYKGPVPTFIIDAVGDLTSGPAMLANQKDWCHVYRLEYKFGAVWKYGITRKVDYANDTVCNNFELYFSPLQGRFKGIAP